MFPSCATVKKHVYKSIGFTTAIIQNAGTKYPEQKTRGNIRITKHWRAFVQPLLRWKSNEYYANWVCICSPRCLTCNAHAPYCHLWPVLLYIIFPHYLINWMILEKNLLNIKCVFWFSLHRLSETFFILGRTERDTIKNVYRSSCIVPLFLNFMFSIPKC